MSSEWIPDRRAVSVAWPPRPAAFSAGMMPSANTQAQLNTVVNPEDQEIELNIFQARQIARCHADESRQQDAARGDTKHTTGNNEEPVLDQKLASQIPPAAADGRSNAELLSARRTLVQQQRCEIDARDQQQQRDRTGEHGHRRRDLTDDAIGRRHQVHGTRRVVLRIFLRQCRLDRLHFGPRGRRCHVWLQSTDRKQRRPRAAALHPAIVRGHLRLKEHVNVRRCQVAKSWRQHADDRERIAVERRRSTDRFGLAAKLAHPERVADPTVLAAPGRASAASKSRPRKGDVPST